MIIKWLDGFSGGRLLVLLVPVALFVIALFVLGASALTQVDNAVILALSIAVLISWRRSISIFLHERQEAANVWLSLGMLIMIATTVVNVAYSLWIRTYGITADDRIVALMRFAYAFSFGCLYLVPLARSSAVPPRGWLSLLCIVVAAAGAALLGMWLT